MRTAFTLTELLITISLIVLLIAIAVPAFSFLTGGRSLEAARNVIAPALGQARAEAIGIQASRGVLFYRDPGTERIQAVLVRPVAPGGWESGTGYSIGDYVVDGTNYYVCIAAHTSGTNKATDLGNSALWKTVASGLFTLQRPVWDIIPNRDTARLPTGVDLRGVGINMAETYGHPALVAFDEYGMLTVRLYYIQSDSIIGERIGAFTNANLNPDPAGSVFSNYSQIGLMLFDAEQGKSAAATAGVSDGAPDEFINDNATPLLINRYNGTIVKGE